MMEAIREQINRNQLVTGIIAGVILGLALGLLFGWVVWPVEYSGAYPRDLVFEEKEAYMRLSIQAYSQDMNAGLAKFRYDYLQPDADKVLTEIIQNPGNLPSDLVMAFSDAVTQPFGEVAVTPGVETTPLTPETTEETPSRSIWSILLPIMCIVGLVVVAGVAFFFLRGRISAEPKTVTPAMEAEMAKQQVSPMDYTAIGEEGPIAQYMASYRFGDDLFDDSFSIDSASGEFLGECGVSISDTIGVGDPKKVSAFEVWLFDKNDIQTVTKVVMSAHAYSDDATRQRLEAKGDAVEADAGREIVLETETLYLITRIVNMNYGQGAMPPGSFFESFILELAVWQK